MMTMLGWLIGVGVVWFLAYRFASLGVWTLTTLIGLLLYSEFSQASVWLLSAYWIIFIAIAFPLNFLPVRRRLISDKLLRLYKRIMPSMSDTEREALEAGTVSWEGDLFQGRPDWRKLFSRPNYTLTKEEQDFLDGPVEQVCSMIDTWDINSNLQDLSPEVWEYLKQEGFFGFIIPKQYGGREFSAQGLAAVLQKLISSSITLGTTVCVPNSLGPAELLLEYGTEDQKNYYLPRLASGKDIPCFALTGPTAGSDAAAMPDRGIICKGTFDGKEVLGMRLTWDKRYITLAPVATVLGLAFRLFDPDHLIGDKEKLGITCALIPVKTPGLVAGRRHKPVGVPFMNGPTSGTDVFVPLDYIIGGVAMAGQGWRMLMECLGAGRAISLPSTAVGGGKIAAMATGAYARIRRQFNLPIGAFEGIQEPLARIAGFTYMNNAMLNFTATSIAHGAKPAVASAIVKYHTTEFGRKIANDAMDIHGGKGICQGPKNYLALAYMSSPISITVEGANILTRNLIIFGQGAMRCHPYVFDTFEAALDDDLEKFDKAIFGHIGHAITITFRSLWLSLTGGCLVFNTSGRTKRMQQVMMRYAANFGFAVEIAMAMLGGTLKRRERFSARLGDVLSYLYMASAVMKQYKEAGEPEADKVLVDWCCHYLSANIQHSLHQVIKNFKQPWLRVLMRVMIFPLGRHASEAPDHLDKRLAKILMTPSETRNRLINGIFTQPIPTNPAGMANHTLLKVIAVESIQKRLRKALGNKEIDGLTYEEQVKDALAKSVINEVESKQLMDVHAARMEVINVDDFDPDEFIRVKTKKSKRDVA